MTKFALATILSLFVSVSTVSAAHHVTTNHFRAVLDASIVQPQTDSDHGQSTATAVAHFVLTTEAGDPAATTLSYDIQFDGLDVAPSDNANLFDDITAIHLHDTTVCMNAALCGDGNGGQIPGSTAGTRHVLNILGIPRNGDDADVQVFAADERVTGLWDVNDANTLTPAPTQSIGDQAILDRLFDGKLALMVHTNLVGSGEIGGFLTQIPEPDTISLVFAAVGLLLTGRRH